MPNYRGLPTYPSGFDASLGAGFETVALHQARMQGIETLKQQAIETLVKGAMKAFGDAATLQEQTIRDIADAFGENDEMYRYRMFDAIGKAAQRSMLSSYGQRVTAREGPASASHYRAGHGRLAGGVLRRAIGSAGFYMATPNGLLFGNKALLDAEAAQWHRINSGAGGRGGGGDEASYPVVFGGSGSTLTIEDSPSPGFSMPPGIWVTSEGKTVRANPGRRGQDMFYPSYNPRSHPRATAGIEPRRFMDAGVRRIAQELPLAIETWQKDMFKGLSKIRKNRTARNMVNFGSAGGYMEVEIH